MWPSKSTQIKCRLCSVKGCIIAKFVHKDMRGRICKKRGNLAGKSTKDLPLTASERNFVYIKCYKNLCDWIFNDCYRKNLLGVFMSLRKLISSSFYGLQQKKFIFVRCRHSVFIIKLKTHQQFENFLEVWGYYIDFLYNISW